MSQIGKKPINIPDGVEVQIDSGSVHVKGKLGELTQIIDSNILIEKTDKVIIVNIPSQTKKFKEEQVYFDLLEGVERAEKRVRGIKSRSPQVGARGGGSPMTSHHPHRKSSNS